MIEGKWRIVENADGGDDLYLFREGGGYVWIVQGALWALDKAPIEDLKNMNRPNE